MSAKFEIYIDNSNDHRFRLKAANGENILASEGYSNKAAAKKGIESVKTNAPLDERYEKKVARDDSHYFVLKARNGETIGKSQMYTSASSRDKGIESVKSNAPKAVVEDLSQ